MKTKTSLTFLFIVFLTFSFTTLSFEHEKSQLTKMPDKIKTIVEKSCFGCHNTASKNKDAKAKLDFKKLEGLSTIKKINAYKNIAETIEEESMPPNKFLNKYPDKKLTEQEKKALMDWAEKEAETVVKGI